MVAPCVAASACPLPPRVMHLNFVHVPPMLLQTHIRSQDPSGLQRAFIPIEHASGGLEPAGCSRVSAVRSARTRIPRPPKSVPCHGDLGFFKLLGTRLLPRFPPKHGARLRRRMYRAVFSAEKQQMGDMCVSDGNWDGLDPYAPFTHLRG